MTEQLYPMVPPNILLNNWESDWLAEREHVDVLLTQAYQAGADAELEACCKWLKSEGHEYEHEALFAARRPKPPSLKEKALEAMREMQIEPCFINGVDTNAAIRAKYETIRRALEALPND